MDYLIEIGTEELPAGTTSEIANNLKTLFEKNIKDYGIETINSTVFSTPRRIAIKLTDLPPQSPEKREIIKGPGDKAPKNAIEGFAKKHGLSTNDLQLKDNRYFLEKTVCSVSIKEVLINSFKNATNSLSGERWMTWGTGEYNFSRPVKWILSILGNAVLPIELFGLKSSNQTRVNRQIEALENNFVSYVQVESVKTYEKLLEDNLVFVSRETRREEIKKQVLQLEEEYHLKIEIPEDLLEEVIDLVEQPTVLIGKFEDKFLELPDFLIKTVLIKHQRYFPCFKNNELINKFVFVANCFSEAKDNVVKGNERVLKARLNDAEFFVLEDLKTPLIERKEKLEKMTFQKELNIDNQNNSSMKSKANRLVSIANNLNYQGFLPQNINATELEQASELAKCDLTTQMVFEFPELQGLVGGFILQKYDEKEDIVKAVSEHYLPNFSGGDLPSSILGSLVSIIDKVDNVTSIFFIGKIPTGSADPFALRRQTQGLIEILLKQSLSISIFNLFKCSYASLIKHSNNIANDNLDEVFSKFFFEKGSKKVSLAEFILQRLSFMFSLKHPTELVEALISSENCLKYPVKDISNNFEAFANIQNQANLLNNLISIRRISRILKTFREDGSVDEKLLESNSEKELNEKYKSWVTKIEKSESFEEKWKSLNELSVNIDNFFENNLVEDANQAISKNRKLLLNNVLKKANEELLLPNWDKLILYLELRIELN